MSSSSGAHLATLQHMLAKPDVRGGHVAALTKQGETADYGTLQKQIFEAMETIYATSTAQQQVSLNDLYSGVAVNDVQKADYKDLQWAVDKLISLKIMATHPGVTVNNDSIEKAMDGVFRRLFPCGFNEHDDTVVKTFSQAIDKVLKDNGLEVAVKSAAIIG